jgi:Xaa-Pro aminopeptidase
MKALWEGAGFTQAEASKRSGVKTVMWLYELPGVLDRLVARYEVIYTNAPATVESGPLAPAARRTRWLRRKLPTHQLRSAVNILGDLRTVKAPEEVENLRRAIDITGQGLEKAWAAMRPGMPEYALEAEFTAEYIRQGATGPGFTPIVATGKNATVIHAVAGATKVAKDDLVLFDVSAEFGYYAADISRTVPATGQFTKRQRAVYEAVYRAQQAGFALHKPGASVIDIDHAMRGQLLQELVGLELITQVEATGKNADEHLHKYYPHISHHLGLDVHDSGSPRLAFEPGMVVTCEPGLYIPEEGIGVRLEDDILITETGHEVLSSGIPSEPDEVEKLIQKLQA